MGKNKLKEVGVKPPPHGIIDDVQMNEDVSQS